MGCIIGITIASTTWRLVVVGTSGRSLSPEKEMLFKKARKILASGDKPDVLAAKILRNPIFDVNEFAFQGNALSEGQTLLMVRPPHL
jgi:hypothetical protein